MKKNHFNIFYSTFPTQISWNFHFLTCKVVKYAPWVKHFLFSAPSPIVRILPDYPDYLNVLGRCLLARSEPEVFIEEVEGLSEKVYDKIMDQNNLTIYARCLGRVGREEKASGIRMKLIDNCIDNPIFYNDDAKYLAGKGRFAEALEIIKKVEALGIANEYTRTIKEKIERNR